MEKSGNRSDSASPKQALKLKGVSNVHAACQGSIFIFVCVRDNLDYLMFHVGSMREQKTGKHKYDNIINMII